MRVRLFLVRIVFIPFIITGSWGSSLEAFEIQYPGEGGFFIGKPMVYMITADPGEDSNAGQEGIFIFGQDRITIDGKEYYDCVFESPSGPSHFYFGINPAGSSLIQKGLKLGSTDLKLDPAVTAVQYPLSPDASWSEKTDMTAKDLEIPGLGRFPFALDIKGVKVETEVSSSVISVPAGTLDTLLVEATFTGSMLGIPITMIQRTWLSEDNVSVKRNFEFYKPTELLLYEIELSRLTTTPWDVNWDGLVDMSDVVIVAEHFGERIEKPIISSPDVNGDRTVNVLDLAWVGVHFGEIYSSAAPAKTHTNQ